MKLLVVGVSHHTAPVDMLERLSIPAGEQPGVLAELLAQPYVHDAVVLSTCNRVEVYATVGGFHGGLAQVGEVLAKRAGIEVGELAEHLYAHHDAAAVWHTLRVAAGLDSMVVGEAQILGQLRDAYTLAAERDAVGRILHELMQQALRVGKRVHAETGIDRAGRSVVSAALSLVPHDMVGRRALVIGAGSMGALALATLSRAGVGPLFVANRGRERAERLAGLHGASVVDIADIQSAIGQVELVVCATASPDPVLDEQTVRAALRDWLAARAVSDDRGLPDGRDLVILDLAVPHDVAPSVGQLAGVNLIGMAELSGSLAAEPSTMEREEARRIVAAEVDAFLMWLRGDDVAPTVAALRTRADDVVAAELRRLTQRRPDLSDDQRDAVAHTVHRIVQQLLHSPTVRMRQLAGTPGGEQYVAAVRALFDLPVASGERDPVPPVRNLGLAVDVERDVHGERDLGGEREPRRGGGGRVVGQGTGLEAGLAKGASA